MDTGQSPGNNDNRGFLSSWTRSIASVRRGELFPVVTICLRGVDDSAFASELSGMSP